MKRVAVVLIVSACGGDDGSAAQGCDEGPGYAPHPDCACVPEQSNLVLNPPTCAPILCAVEANYAEFQFCADPPTIFDEDALACALEALRTRTPGVVTWELGGGFCGSFGYTIIFADGRAINRSISYFDYGTTYSDIVLGELRPSAHFEDCASNEDILMRFKCLETTVVASPVDVCPEPVPESECEG